MQGEHLYYKLDSNTIVKLLKNMCLKYPINAVTW